jgi:hypothetical protein
MTTDTTPITGAEEVRTRNEQADRIHALSTLNETYLRAIDRIRNMLHDEAVEREWCDEYTEFVDKVNEGLPNESTHLLPCNKTYEVTFTATMTPDEIEGLECRIDRLLDHGDCSDFEYSSV